MSYSTRCATFKPAVTPDVIAIPDDTAVGKSRTDVRCNRTRHPRIFDAPACLVQPGRSRIRMTQAPSRR